MTSSPSPLLRPQRIAFIAGIFGIALCVIGFVIDRSRFFQSYLVAYIFCLGIALGSLAILMLQHLTGGRWGLVLRRLLEAACRTIPLLATLFLPLVFGLNAIYPWALPERVAADPVLEWKLAYLNVPFFLARAAVYFMVWMLLAGFLNRWSSQEDRGELPGGSQRFQKLSAPGLGLYGLTVTFASIDWAMSLDAHWYSTIFGVLFALGQILSAFCLMVVLIVLLAGTPPLASLLDRSRIRDLGSLLLAFVMIWAYLAFSQFLLIWSANLRTEVPWYLDRLEGGWQLGAVALILAHFVLPFMLLLSSDIKANAPRLAWVACLVLLMRFVDLYWTIMPAFSPGRLQVHWLDLATLLAVGGLWLGCFLRQIERMPLAPLHDPRLMEVSHHG